jgi:glycosyltransferase involved in cell wall biosynthesis
MSSELAVAFLGSYPPRACGIATFTRDLSDAIAGTGRHVAPRIVAIDDEGSLYRYPRQVRWRIDQQDPSSWRDAARALNDSNVALVSIQHEFGIDGHFERDGRFVDHLPYFLEEIRKPIVTTLHTVLPSPRVDLREPIRYLHARSAAMISMVNMARLILEEEYGLCPDKLQMIPHGVPEIRRVPTDRAKQSMQLGGRTVLATFGLLSSGKGIQYVIRALPDVVRRHPDVLYLVIGKTHPEIRRREGERYRNSLIELVKRHGLEKHVRFVNQYVSQDQLISYLQATDIYITPYVNRNQITSGTLAYALGAGKAVISTPYLYAAEALAEGRGLLAEFGNPKSFARCVRLLLEEPALREHCERSALAYGKPMGWDAVGNRYADLFLSCVDETQYQHPIVQLKQPQADGEPRELMRLRTAT